MNLHFRHARAQPEAFHNARVRSKQERLQLGQQKGYSSPVRVSVHDSAAFLLHPCLCTIYVPILK